MGSGLEENAILSLIRGKLNSERIKLWMPPYSDEEGNRAEFTLDLVKRYAAELHMPQEEVETAIESLRVSSLERLSARNRFLDTGIASLKVKTAYQSNAEKNAEKRVLTIETKLDVTGLDFRNMVAQHLHISGAGVKLISSGTIIVDDATLTEQGVSPSSAIMAIVVASAAATTSTLDSESNQNLSALQRTKEDAELLANRSEKSDEDYGSLMRIADQNGRSLEIPRSERKALGMAMILSEKGKSALKRQEYSRALLLFLEADKEFKKCSASLLAAVDNYALLCLDITWCYLCLKSIEDLPDAETRLKTCEDCLQRSYGTNLERLRALKGSTSSEAALLVRLHLMKGIAAYHKRQWKLASNIFASVEEELRSLKVDDGKLSEVMSLGYSASEARLGLRNSSGNVEMAVNYIMNKKEEKMKLAVEEEEQERKTKRARKLGQTVNGEWINYDFYESLLRMGTPRGAAREALAQSNNNVSMAVQIIHDHPELLNLPEFNCRISDEMVAQVVSCGFNLEVARQCLQKHKGDVSAAIDELSSNGGTFAEMLDDGNEEEDNKRSQESRLEHEALHRLREDITDNEDAHLDITLEEECTFLEEYKLLLKFAQQ